MSGRPKQCPSCHQAKWDVPAWTGRRLAVLKEEVRRLTPNPRMEIDLTAPAPRGPSAFTRLGKAGIVLYLAYALPAQCRGVGAESNALAACVWSFYGKKAE